MKKLVFGSSVAFAALFWASPARAYCPSYTPAITATTQKCGVDPAPGSNPTIATWQGIFARVAGGMASWGSDGPTIGTLGNGCGHPNPSTQVPAHFPCHVLMAIAMQESGWRQFCVPDAPASEKGQPERTIVSFDCGYGIGQVTSGMHTGESPSFDRARVASDPTYNLATGTRILRDKWAATKCVGDNNPELVEDWYTAIWAYNGLAYSNNPNNPNLTAGRGPYDPASGAGSYAYQERVLGWMEHPPSARWDVLAPAYPNLGDLGTSGSPPELPEPSCASPTSCAQKRTTHTSRCGAAPSPADAGAGDAAADAAADAAPRSDGGPAPKPDGAAPGPSGRGDASPGGVGSHDGSPSARGGDDPSGAAPSDASSASGCACRAATGGPAHGALATLLFGLLAVVRAARRTRRSASSRYTSSVM